LRKEREMTTRKKTTKGKAKVNKLELKKDTLRDLDVKGKGALVRAGQYNASVKGQAMPTCHC
jgi:hypothetical protein